MRVKLHKKILSPDIQYRLQTSIKLLLLWIRSFPDTPTRLVTTMPRFPQDQTISAITSSSLQNSARQPLEQRTPTFMYLSMWSYSQDGVYTSPLSLSSRFGCPQSSSSITPTTGGVQRLTGSTTTATTVGITSPTLSQTGLLST